VEVVEIENIDFLTIKIEYKNSISLYSFKQSLDGWYNQYNKHLSQSNIKKEDNTLLIKEIKEGSVIMTLISSAIPLFGHVETLNTVTTFFTSIKNIITYLTTKKGNKPKYDIDELENIKQIVAPITSEDKSINITSNGDKNTTIVIDSLTVNIVRQNADEEIKRLSVVQEDKPVPDETFKEKVYLKFKQIESAERNTKSTKGVIGEIDSKSYPISFDEGLKPQIMQGIDNPLIKKYLVNAKVHKENGVTSGYTVLKIIDVIPDDSQEQEGNSLFLDNG
jgi:hypothetical protein